MRGIEVLVLAQESCQMAYLETVLQLEAPGTFRVTTGSPSARKLAADLVILEVDAEDPGSEALVTRVLARAGATPVIVVSRWSPGLAHVNQLMRAGADDVLVLAELTSHRLAEAVLKAIERRARWSAPARRVRGARSAFPVPIRTAQPAVHHGLASGLAGLPASDVAVEA